MIECRKLCQRARITDFIFSIIGCGLISGRFVRDLVLHRPEIRDVAHSIIAVAARDQSRAKQFIADNCPDGASAQLNGLDDRSPNAYGSYEEVYNHPVSSTSITQLTWTGCVYRLCRHPSSLPFHGNKVRHWSWKACVSWEAGSAQCGRMGILDKISEVKKRLSHGRYVCLLNQGWRQRCGRLSCL